MFRKLDETELLTNMNDIALDDGIEAIEIYYKISPHILCLCRKEFPEVDSAIIKALKQRPRRSVTSIIKAKNTENKLEKKEVEVSKIYNGKFTTRELPKEIVDKNMNGIEDQADNELDSFRRLKKKLEHSKRFLDVEFEDMI